MAEVTAGVLHPGEMGTAVGAALRSRGVRVIWASEGRSDETRRRAGEARLEDVESVEELAHRADVVFSICPPHAAVDLARALSGFTGIYVDCNAVSPATMRGIADVVPRVVDGGIIGPPPRAAGTTRLYLAGREAPAVADLFEGTPMGARVVSDEIGRASALKMAYAAWTKGTSALLLAVRSLARTEGVEPTLLEEWSLSLPELPELSVRAARSAATKGWRWVGEMEEVAGTFAAAGLPDGFHLAAADVFRTISRDLAQAWPRAVPS
jgi:3-hydroxyisobutyrate dehydrogenase-like beta-hydroxyacid dehydrogenase